MQVKRQQITCRLLLEKQQIVKLTHQKTPTYHLKRRETVIEMEKKKVNLSRRLRTPSLRTNQSTGSTPTLSLLVPLGPARVL
jgi:hypothetical protein